MAAGVNLLPFPLYGAPFRVLFPMLDADGDLVANCAGDTPDSEVSKDCGNFADCTNEMTEIEVDGGMYYLDLTGTEMTADSLVVIAKVATATTKTTPIVLYPRRLPSIRTGTAQAGAEGSITLDASASAVDSFYKGCYVQATNNDPAGIQGQTRVVTAYVGSTKVVSIAPNWATTPTSATTFSVLVPENAIVSGYQGVVAPDLVDAGSYTTARAGYLDKLNVTGTLAHSDAAATYKADVANLDAAVSTRSSHTAANVAALVLVTPANLLATDASGQVTVADLSTTAKASVNAEADAALADVNLDHLIGTATGIPALVAGTYLDQIADDGTAVYSRTTDSLQALRDRGDVGWITGGGGADQEVG